MVGGASADNMGGAMDDAPDSFEMDSVAAPESAAADSSEHLAAATQAATEPARIEPATRPRSSARSRGDTESGSEDEMEDEGDEFRNGGGMHAHDAHLRSGGRDSELFYKPSPPKLKRAPQGWRRSKLPTQMELEVSAGVASKRQRASTGARWTGSAAPAVTENLSRKAAPLPAAPPQGPTASQRRPRVDPMTDRHLPAAPQGRPRIDPMTDRHLFAATPPKGWRGKKSRQTWNRAVALKKTWLAEQRRED